MAPPPWPSDNPCSGKSERRILAWYVQGGVKYPLRCGRTGRSGYGYLHITQDPADDGAIGHGDPINDTSFSSEITATLARGAEGVVGGGTWRNTLGRRQSMRERLGIPGRTRQTAA